MSTARQPCRLQLARDDYDHRHGVLAGYLPELVAMQHGLRPAIQLSMPDEDALAEAWPVVHGRAEQLGLHLSQRAEGHELKILLSRIDLGSYEYNRPRRSSRLVAYARGLVAGIRSRRLGVARERIEDLRRGDTERHGQLYGYPACCVRALEDRGHPPAFIDDLRGLLRGAGAYPFEMNPFLRTTPFHLYKQVPCSLRCGETQAAGRELLALLEQEEPRLAEQIRDFCRLPVLFTDVCSTGIVLDGQAEGDRVRYRGIHVQGHPGSLLAMSSHNSRYDLQLFDEIVALLGRGDEVACGSGRVRVFHGGAEVGEVVAPSHLLWRIVHFA